MSRLLDWAIYATLWAIAVAILAIPYKITLTHGLWWGLFAWITYFGAIDLLYRLLGHRRGIRDVP